MARSTTVLMIQVENEVGLLEESRDYSPAANQAFAGPVPKELMDYLQQHKDSLVSEISATCGRKTASKHRAPGRKSSGRQTRG